MDSGLPDYQAAIDDALQLVYSQHHRLITSVASRILPGIDPG